MITKNTQFKKKKDSQTLFFSILIGVLLFGTIAFLIISNLRISQKRTDLTARIESLRAEIQTLEEQKRELESGIAQTQSETYWEEKAREQGYQKPGEETVVVLPPEEEEKGEAEEEESFWQKLLDKLGF
jgi:cell division protein FtsB